MCLSSSNRLANLLHMVAVAAASWATKEGKPHISDCLTFAIIPPAKASHTVKLRVSISGDCPETWVEEINKLEAIITTIYHILLN